MLHLAYVTMMLAPFDTGGPATVAHCLLRKLTKMNGLSITLIVGDSAIEKEIISTFGDRFENITRIPLGRSMYDYIYIITRKMKEVWQALDYVDIIHVNALSSLRNFYLPFLALLRRKPSVYTYHGVGVPEIHDVFHGEKARIVKRLALSAIQSLHEPLWSKIVVNSQFVKTTLLKQGFDKEKIHLIPNGIDFDGVEKAERANLNGDIRLLFVGKIKAIKGIDLLLEALSMLKSSLKKRTKLYIVGSGPREEEYKLLTTKLKVDKYVQFLGHLPLNKCYSLYKSCDLLILPSRLESYPMVLLEALGCGIPVIATNVGGIPEIIKDGRNGLLVKRKPSEIAQKIQFLIDHPEVRKQISKNNLTDAKQYSWQKIAHHYLDLYRSLV